MKLILLLLSTTITLTLSYPGLLKIPKVYNALITSDQNLTPSRAFPVLQPVVHRTALGYVPPLYYPQFAPQYIPEVIDLSQISNISPDKVANEQTDNTEKNSDAKINSNDNEEKSQKKAEQPLKFYPNYQTVLYEPYFYSYSGLGPQVKQVSYQEHHSQQMLDPLPPDVKERYPERLLPHLQDEVPQQLMEREKIPDVPPPPVPTGSPKNRKSS